MKKFIGVTGKTLIEETKKLLGKSKITITDVVANITELETSNKKFKNDYFRVIVGTKELPEFMSYDPRTDQYDFENKWRTGNHKMTKVLADGKYTIYTTKSI